MKTTSGISSAWTPATNLGRKCFAGAKLWAIGKVLREMLPDGDATSKTAQSVAHYRRKSGTSGTEMVGRFIGHGP